MNVLIGNAAIGMKAPQIKIGLTALFVLALGWIAWSFHSQVQVQWAFPPIKYRKIELSSKKVAEKVEKLVQTKSEKAVKRRSPDEYKVLYELNITGKERPKPVDPTKPPEPVVSKAVASILKVGYTQLVSDDPKGSRAFVLYTDPMITQPLKEAFLHLGDHLPVPFGKYFVVEIQPRVVVFGEDGTDKKEEVGLSDLSFQFSGIEPGPGGRVTSRSGQPYPTNYVTPEETTEMQPGEFWISHKEAEQFETNYQGMLKDVQSEDYYDPKTRKPAGVVVNGLGQNSIATKYGVQQGDIIKSINGYPVSKKSQAIEWVKKNPDLPSYTVEIERMGKIITKTYVPPPKKK